ncbi:MAG: tetratricopeptide repeat protein [Thermoguttaceae bacterium]
MTVPLRHCVLFSIAGALLLAASAQLRADEADDLYAVALGHYDRGRWKLAAESLQKFRQRYANDRRQNLCTFCLGESLFQLGQFDQALGCFRDYARRVPDGQYAKETLLQLGQCAYLAGHYSEAKPELERFLAKHPDDRWRETALLYLGQIALNDGEPAAAASRLSEALRRFPDGRLQDDCRVALGRAYEMQGQQVEAERLYRGVIARPGGTQADAAQFHLGALQYESGRYAEAIESFGEFEGPLSMSAWQPNARLGHGLALLKLGRPADATKQFDAVLSAKAAGDELFQRALRGNIQAALQRKDYESLDRRTAEFEKRFPGSPFRRDVQRLTARSLIERKQFDRAVILLEGLLRSSDARAETRNERGVTTGGPHLAPPNKGNTTPSTRLLTERGETRQDIENRYLLALSYEGASRYADALAAVQPVVDHASGALQTDAQLERAVLLVATKRYADAVAPFEAVLATAPSGEAEAKSLAGLAISLARTGQVERAKPIYDRLVTKYAKHPLATMATEQLADAAYEANDAAWATALSNRLTATGASTALGLRGRLNLGWSQYKAGKLAEAADTFGQLLDRHPPAAMAAEAALIRGHILEKLGRNDPALAMYTLVIEQHPASPQHADALLAAARLRNNLKQWSAAAETADRLAHDHPQYEKLDAAIYERAWAQLQLGKTDEARRLFERLHADFPRSRYWADATCRMAQRAFDAKDYDRADRLLDALSHEKSDPQVRKAAMYLLGQVAVARRDWSKARDAFDALVKESPTASQRLAAETWIAEADYQLGNLAAAEARLDRLAKQIADKREPWMALIPLRRAQILAKREQWSEAAQIAAAIEKDFPRFDQQYDVDCLLGQCLAMQADFDAARRAYARVILSPTGAKTETAARAQWLIGESYFHQKNYEAALREYLKLEILYAYPAWQAAALFEAAKCHELLGQKKEAAEVYRQLLDRYPKSPLVADAKKRLRDLRPSNARGGSSIVAPGKKTPIGR